MERFCYRSGLVVRQQTVAERSLIWLAYDGEQARSGIAPSAEQRPPTFSYQRQHARPRVAARQVNKENGGIRSWGSVLKAEGPLLRETQVNLSTSFAALKKISDTKRPDVFPQAALQHGTPPGWPRRNSLLDVYQTYPQHSG